ncbi:PadR family transcriptional regulator [Leucobacter allii]|uniref:PadR family transcriptional regulator n=1 Tax=Leucobacter allii TaxID=2932247 RepID=A0ABY4FMH1_9MICO|nr:PaaX family transcriptional regulator C-terminal domain-containing protein [Leucobacter allii]UOQ57478.1 PadR family transcriptional regulator [Leucobacter allii]UOR01935.1 PadR family transcriptional regulator [Leucobacter allii]
MIPRSLAPRADEAPRGHRSRSLVLALLGELLRAGRDGPLRGIALVDVLEHAGVAAPAARAALDRFALSGFLDRDRSGRHLVYGITPSARSVLTEASRRVHAEHPFDASGPGWTLVTFSIPEGQRGLRHQLRAALAWEGFAVLRDGLWIAPGRRDPETALAPVRAELPLGGVLAFHAAEIDGFPVDVALRSAWDFAAIRAEHERFIARWSDPGAADGMPALAALTVLVSDWLELLRRDPRLPAGSLDPDWPAPCSLAAYRARRAEIADAADAAMREGFPQPA